MLFSADEKAQEPFSVYRPSDIVVWNISCFEIHSFQILFTHESMVLNYNYELIAYKTVHEQ